ncbi:MAG: hypothetical protein ACK5M4_11115 [Pseudorhodobacter sp.]
MVHIELTTILDQDADRLWQIAMRTELLDFVTYPLVKFTPLEPASLPEIWVAGEYRLAMRLFGVLPIGWQVISISFPVPEGQTRYLRDNGHGRFIRRWDHLISIAPEGAKTRYTDRVEIEAGILTGLVALCARLFYAHRQRRWRRLVRDLH